jgi:hypothetical protein
LPRCADVTTYLDRNSAGFDTEVVFGQTGVVATTVMDAYRTATSGPSGTFLAAFPGSSGRHE